MKTLFRIFLLSLLVLLAACEEEVSGAFLPVPDANGYVTCSMELNGGVVAYEGATRSSNGYEWNDGDRLYIRFATDNDTVLGYANYDGNKAEWQVSYAGSLKSGVTKGCEVYFFENATHKDNTTVELTVLSAIYQDTAAVYRFESNTVLLNATLHPKTGRVRFVSQNRDEFSLAGIRYYIGFDLSNKEFNLNYRRRLVLNAHQLQNNGEYSTDYLYGFYEENYDGSVRKEVPLGLDIINHADTSKVYHKDFAVEMLNAGNSGYITLPSESVNQGWSVDKFNGGRYFAKWKYRGPEMYADGGILYGVLLNGNVIFDYDDSWYYCWGDRDSDGDYLTDGKYYTGTGSISKTMYDLAYAWYNDNAYMPTKSAVSQMLSLNRYSNFCLVSDDFNVLALGSTYGYEDLESSEDYDVESKYLWTASAISSTNAYAAVFAENGYLVKSMHKKYGMGFLITFDKELANNNNDHRSYNGINNGYEYADLGLPSGTKWATCNVGATKPEEYGGYYAWGETEEKEDYSWETYKWCNGSETSITKYCTNSSYGDNKTVLDPEDDVAHVKWGSSWRMPTEEELDELRSNCTFEWSILNGVDCYKVASKKNGNCIYLPVAGCFKGTDFGNNGIGGTFWTSSLCRTAVQCAYGYTYNNSTPTLDWGSYWSGYKRNYGRSVRPVCGNEKTCQITVSSSGNGTAAIKGRDKTSLAFIVGSTVTVVATPDEGYAFEGWYVGDALVSTDAEYAFTVSEDVELTAKFVPVVYEAVDWTITLGASDGLPGENVQKGTTTVQVYKSDVIKPTEALETLRFTVAQNYNGEKPNGNNFITALSELVVYASDGETVIPYTAITNADHNTLSGGTDGAGLAALNDGNWDNYWQSNWSSKAVADYHYLELTFEAPISEFVLEWGARPGDPNNAPTLVGLTPGGVDYVPYSDWAFTVGEDITSMDALLGAQYFVMKSNVPVEYHTYVNNHYSAEGAFGTRTTKEPNVGPGPQYVNAGSVAETATPEYAIQLVPADGGYYLYFVTEGKFLSKNPSDNGYNGANGEQGKTAKMSDAAIVNIKEVNGKFEMWYMMEYEGEEVEIHMGATPSSGGFKNVDKDRYGFYMEGHPYCLNYAYILAFDWTLQEVTMNYPAKYASIPVRNAKVR